MNLLFDLIFIYFNQIFLIKHDNARVKKRSIIVLCVLQCHISDPVRF